MNGTSRRLLVVFAAVGLGVILAGRTSAAGLPCSQRVLTDWSDNGRIDRVYALPCYEEAIATLPTDIRDYTNAQDVIDRAMTSAVRARSVVPAADAEASDTRLDAIDASGVPVPIPLVVLLALALALLAAGAVTRIGRRVTLGGKGPPR